MNQQVKELLSKCKVAKIPEYNDKDSVLIIDKVGNTETEDNNSNFVIGSYYIIKLQKYLIYPPDNFTLNVNWNKGINPKSEYMLVTPLKFIGKMIQFDGCGYDICENNSLDDVYSGLWLPNKSIEIVRALN